MTRSDSSDSREKNEGNDDLKKEPLVVAGGGNPEDRLGGTHSIGKAGHNRIGSLLRHLPLEGIDGNPSRKETLNLRKKQLGEMEMEMEMEMKERKALTVCSSVERKDH